MSADTWRKCPICGIENDEEDKTVRIDLIFDFDLMPSGEIKHSAVGYCTRCKLKFK